MTAAIGKYAAKKMLNGQLKKYAKKEPAGEYDPFYEYRTDSRGRKKKFKKQIPAYIPPHDADILASVRKRAYYLDMSLFTFMGVRFGWSSVIGLIPAIGDALDMLMALSVYMECRKVEGGLDAGTKMKMKIWIIVDFLIGLVPFVGDLLDASFKANTQNVRLLEIALDKKYKPSQLKIEEEKKTAERQKRDSHYRPPAPATVYEDMSEDENLPQYASRDRSPQPPVQRPDAALAQQERRGGEPTDRPAKKSRSSWFGGRGGGDGATRDVEMAQTRHNTQAGNSRLQDSQGPR